ncbi:hypothetical protein, partial [Phenylobacterium sp.]|uniref:hypothetical protein n=1 Tax=Phenylobacterium sp. TaxID=1871053 RepID=UPI0025E14E9B
QIRSLSLIRQRRFASVLAIGGLQAPRMNGIDINQSKRGLPTPPTDFGLLVFRLAVTPQETSIFEDCAHGEFKPPSCAMAPSQTQGAAGTLGSAGAA